MKMSMEEEGFIVKEMKRIAELLKHKAVREDTLPDTDITALAVDRLIRLGKAHWIQSFESVADDIWILKSGKRYS